MAEIKTLSLNPNYFNESPSRACLVCGKTEKENARIIYSDGAWLCDRCRSTLLKLINDFNATSNASNALNALDCMENIPAADVRPVVRGIWEKQDANFVCNDVGLYSAAYKCNRCGKLNIAETNYCPNCGAMMEEN